MPNEHIENHSYGFRFFLVYYKRFVRSYLIAERDIAAGRLPFQRALANPAPDFLAQLGGVVFRKPFHKTFENYALRPFRYMLGCVMKLDVAFSEVPFINRAVVFIAGEAVGPIYDNRLEHVLAAVLHKPLKIRPVICPT